MKLLYIGRYQFKQKEDGTYALPAYGDFFWKKYLDVFDSVVVLGEDIKGYLNDGTLSKITDGRIKVDILPPNTKPTDFKNDSKIKSILTKYIEQFDAILIKPSSRKGMMAIRICNKISKKYMIEITGDLNLTLKQHKNPLKRLYGPLLHRKITKTIKDCEFGLYVTQEYLQKVYPIKGAMCGVTDTIIPNPSEIILQQRLSKIKEYNDDHVYKIGMVATYHDTRKGLDTAVAALSKIISPNLELHVLGIGTEEDRNKWYDFAKKYSFERKLFFDKPASTIDDVLKWNDNVDVIILPSRSEGLPRCIVESISRAVPCVISNVCGMPELVESKWLHNPGDVQTLSKKVREMISDKENMLKAANHNFVKSKDYEFEKLKNKRNIFLMTFKENCIKK